MELPTDFKSFLTAIRPTENQRSELKTGHTTLRSRLKDFQELKDVYISDFLQGSYRRATAVRPKGEKRSDVDIIVVTKLHEEEYTPDAAMDIFVPFLDKYYKDKWQRQGRSFGISLSYVDLDLVITSAPSEAEIGALQSESVTSETDIAEAKDWRLHPSWLSSDSRWLVENAQELLAKAKSESEWKLSALRIPNREAGNWEDTHPLMQIQWTRDKNASTNYHFVNVVKALKWWKIENYDEAKHPKGFPLERIIGDCCPDGITSVANGIVTTLESIVSNYMAYSITNSKPILPDYGVPGHDVLGRLSSEDFNIFYNQAEEGAKIARRAYDSQDRNESGNLWRKLLGSKFPAPPDNGGKAKAGYTTPAAAAAPGGGRFATTGEYLD
ncbi:hypothetical protein SAMN02745216_02530 [Desulfatibacillum alkenivorans DSM 16219]|uniref:Nucleotidyltransferase domain-containing protein n=1 Tax=Desulfatibacillum alkenivorans DSM 16219 TaxID=1121393 RepID=A0A1M6N6C2_9BACT|nr:nucleotidyltransferase [Desulfatibacillum alkenivorans]SHJ91271.1 hypothetical protein SAMN02745216_02530 [Desulfatibacillum alkenivorans DSM 16219]